MPDEGEGLEVQIDEADYDSDGNYIGDDPDLQDGSQGEGGDSDGDLLANKFEDVGELEKAYLEAQQKISQLSQSGGDDDSGDGNDGPVSTEDGKIPTGDGDDSGDSVTLDTALEDIENDGEISDSTFEALEVKGISRDQVETYVRGTTQLGNQLVSELQETVGGEESFKALLGWAQQNLSEAEVAAYNSAIDDGNPAMAKMLLRGMKSQYNETAGQDPDLINSETAPEGGVRPFETEDEIVRAMGDERYETDGQYTRQVNRRLAATDWF